MHARTGQNSTWGRFAYHRFKANFYVNRTGANPVELVSRKLQRIMENRSQNLTGQRALLADDEEGVRQVLRMLLECLGLEVTEAVNGKEALEVYQRGKFDVVVTDYNMPQKRGDALAQEIKSLNPHQRIVMISGFAGRILQDGKLPAFIDVLVSKPCTINELAAALR
jgi:two-component system cell cycle sensor histidine kinase/response regulator CckA